MAPPPIPRGSSLASPQSTDTPILTAPAQCPGVPSDPGQSHISPETPGSPGSGLRPAAPGCGWGCGSLEPSWGRWAAASTPPPARRRCRRRGRGRARGGFVYHLSGEGEEQTGSVRAGRDIALPSHPGARVPPLLPLGSVPPPRRRSMTCTWPPVDARPPASALGALRSAHLVASSGLDVAEAGRSVLAPQPAR